MSRAYRRKGKSSRGLLLILSDFCASYTRASAFDKTTEEELVAVSRVAVRERIQPGRLGDLLLPNRVVMAPYARASKQFRHVPNDLMLQYYEQRATAGLIISEGTWVSEDGQGWLGAPGISRGSPTLFAHVRETSIAGLRY
jgi:hypothetical protein